jgi:hypothetical protein
MIHHGGMRERGEISSCLHVPTMMNHGVVSTPMISENVSCVKHGIFITGKNFLSTDLTSAQKFNLH